MMSGFAEAIELCRKSRVQANWIRMVYSDDGLCTRWDPEMRLVRYVRVTDPMPDPTRYVRKPYRTRPNMLISDISPITRLSHRNEPLLPSNGDDGVITPWSPSRGVDEQVYGVIGDPGGRGLGEHDVHVGGAEDLLERIESETAKLALDEVGPVLHDGLELDVAVPRLPSWDEVEHVGAVGRLPVFAALGAGQGYAQDAEEGLVRDLVPHAEKARVEVDFGGEGRDGQETGRPNDQERRDRLVEESWVHVGGLLEDDDVAPGPLGGAHLCDVCVCARCVKLRSAHSG